MKYFIGLDLGQAADYTALCVLEKVTAAAPVLKMMQGYKPGPGAEVKASYHLRHLERPKLGTPYPEIVDRTRQVLEALPKVETCLIIDATGCGRPVFDMFKQQKLNPVGITIHGGGTVTRAGGLLNVPKRDLVGVLQVLFQSGRLKVAEDLPDAKTFIDELLNFKVKINTKTAHDSYEAWRENINDDLVLAVSLAAWYEEKQRPAARTVTRPAGL
jgi:hypothetical protein